MEKKKNKKNQMYIDRVKCNCVAQKHELINNCLSCGKVVCAREGEGPCLYCGNLVTRPDGKFIVNDQSLFPQLKKQQLEKVSQERSKAVLHKNTLVERDKSTNMGQNIYDQSLDYYDVSENQWLDEQSREAAVNRLIAKDKFVEEERFKQRIQFDPLSGKFVTVDFHFDEEEFKNEGKAFMMENEQRELQTKMKQAQKAKFDTRLLQNEKVKRIVDELKNTGDKPSKPVGVDPQKIAKKNKTTEIILEEETNEQVQ